MWFLLGAYVGIIGAAAAVIRIRHAWGAVYEYHGWGWLAVPFFLAQGVWWTREGRIASARRSPPAPQEEPQ